jgi:pimeloyl-ACP methyl ester carboxylesterase
MSRLLFNARVAAALALAVLLVGVAAKADVIILKDGFTIHAVKTVKEKDLILDPNFGAIITDKAHGMTAADDGPRWVVFPNSALQVADVSPSNRFKDFASYTREFTKGTNNLPSTAMNPVDKKPWDYKTWTKEVKYDDRADNRLMHSVKLHISVITPYYLRIGSSTHKIARYILTKEWGGDRVRKFIVNHPDLAEEPGKPDAGKREKLIRFWIQGDFLDEADKDLDQLLKDLPTEKERYAQLKSEVNSLRAGRLMVEIEQARDAGRHRWAMEALDSLPKSFPKEDVPKGVAQRVTELRAEYETRNKQFDQARRYLSDLMKKAEVGGNKWLIEAATAVRDEMHLDTLSRLEVFLTLAERAEKDAKAGERPRQSPEELLAAAITGWHLGKVAAEAKVDQAYRVWTARLMALEYLRTPAPNTRHANLANYLAKPTALKYDELEKLVSLLPPPDAPAEPPKGPAAMQLPKTVQMPNGVDFVVRLPDEYQPGRSYPLLILLPDPTDDQRPPASPMQNFLDRFGDLPSKLGYIVVVPQWWDPDYPVYRYTKEEQAVVMALLSHLRRTYQVDSDRIFLWGNGEGGSLALDMGGSHPDIFAGVVPVNPSLFPPLYIPCQYWVNFFQLPVYLIMGDKFGASVDTIRMMSERWMPKGFPSLIVSYKGRSREWFSGELPYAFDWMGRKHRADPGKQLGPTQLVAGHADPGFSSVRFADNRFHWLSTDEIKPERVLTVTAAKEHSAPHPAKFLAKITGNTIEGKVFGVRQLTIWFGKGMVDYTKPVTVQIATDKTTLKDKKLITPDIAVLMEDLYQRADRQRPYFAKIEFNKVP